MVVDVVVVEVVDGVVEVIVMISIAAPPSLEYP